MGCFVRGGKNGIGCFVRGDKNCIGCFVRGGNLMRDVLSGVSKNGMGCFVPGCFVLHSAKMPSDIIYNLPFSTEGIKSETSCRRKHFSIPIAKMPRITTRKHSVVQMG